MPNRIIKESICTSQNLDNLSPEEEILFYRLIVNCDDYGRMDARIAIIRSKCFPLRTDRITEKDVLAWLGSLVKHELVSVYQSGGYYLRVNTWEKHQQIRAKRSKYPEPNNENMQSFEIICNQLLSIDSKCTRNPIQSNPIQSNTGISSDIKCKQMIAKRDQYPTPGLTTDREKEKERKGEESIKKEIPKKPYGEFKNVLLTDAEHQKLQDRFGARLPGLIEELSSGIESHGYKYKNFYATILNWAKRREGGQHGRRALPTTEQLRKEYDHD